MQNLIPKVRNRLNYLRNKKYEIYTDEYSIIFTPAFDYSLPIYHIKQDIQIKQLENIGYKDFEIVDLAGKFIDINSVDKESAWLHYISMK
jgi:hypothetical protein